MCGLVGIWRHDGRAADFSAIASMLATIAHRGPDGEGVWHEGRVAFGHRRLSIIDLTEASDQPMLTADRTGVLVYNGEVYNYPELRRELEREGVQFRSAGDVEVVLQALHHWGPERSIPRFDGMFALVYLDRREGALWLARDRVGIKPLVVADTGTDLLFASEAKALLAHPRMQSLPDRHAIATSILSRGFGSTRLLFAGIDALEPGSWWKVTENRIAKHRYFHVLTALDVDRLVAASAMDPASFVSSFRDVLKRSVGLHLASDVPLAAMCSGGVDSSLIAAYAKEQLPGIQAYVADVIGPDAEGNQAERVGRHLGIPVQRVIVDRARFLALWPISVWHSDGPPNHSSDPALLAVTQKCRADGIKVLLTGEGCDELFGGYHWYQTTYSNWSRVSSWRRHFTPGRKARKALIHSPFASMVQTSAKFRNRLIVALDADEGLLPRRILALLEPVESVADRAFIANTLCNLHDYLTGILHRHDRIGMAASMEMRVPFLENEMFDFAFHLPRRVKLHKKVGKWVVKQAAAEVLPADVVYAKKKGFPVHEAFSRGTQHLLVGGALADLLEWPAKTTQEIIALLEKHGELRFQLVGLELWARIFFSRRSAGRVGREARCPRCPAESNM